MIDLKKIAARLDDGDTLRLNYRFSDTRDGSPAWEVRTGRVLDVAEDRGLLYVEQDGVPIWVKIEEAVEIIEG